MIARTAAQYVDEVQASAGIRVDAAPRVLDEIYDNAVFPAHGTRPVFSTVHAVLGGSLVNAALWAIERGAPAGSALPLSLGADAKQLRVDWQGEHCVLPVNFELHGLRQRASIDYRTLLAVHEAGHGLIYAVLMGRAPKEVRINVASFNGGYVRGGNEKAWSRRIWRDDICVSLAGCATEHQVFGVEASTTGAEGDLRHATAEAMRAVRHFGFGTRLGRTDVTSDSDDNLNTDVQPTSAEAEALLAAEMARAATLLQEHGTAFRQLVRQLLADGAVPAATFGQVTGLAVRVDDAQGDANGPEPWHARWEAFAGNWAVCYCLNSCSRLTAVRWRPVLSENQLTSGQLRRTPCSAVSRARSSSVSMSCVQRA